MAKKNINILLIDDHNLFRNGLKYLLKQQVNFNVIADAADGLEGIKLARQLNPDVVLLDIDMPIMNGKETLVQLLAGNPKLIVIMLTVSEDSTNLTECMKIGAKGYLLKNIDTSFLLESIERAVNGDSILSPEMTNKLIAGIISPDKNSAHNKLATLTDRENEILLWLAKGASNKSIAKALSLAESTVKVHVQNIFKKLNLDSRVQAAIYAVEHRISNTN